MAEMKALIASDVNLIVKDIPSDYKTSAALNKKKVLKEPSPKEVKREQRAIKSLLNKQQSINSTNSSDVVEVRCSQKIPSHNTGFPIRNEANKLYRAYTDPNTKFLPNF